MILKMSNGSLKYLSVFIHIKMHFPAGLQDRIDRFGAWAASSSCRDHGSGGYPALGAAHATASS